MGEVLKKTLFAISTVFTKDNNLSKKKISAENNRYMLQM